MPVSDTERVRVHRQRKKAGAGVLLFVPLSDEVATAETLIAAGLLAANQADDPIAVAAAAGKALDALTAKHKLECK